MFRNLPSFKPTRADLQRLAEHMLEPPEKDDGGEGPPAPPPAPPGEYPAPTPAPVSPPVDFDNPDIPAGYTYLGQFIDHDITFDPVSSLQRLNDPDALHDFRTPSFDLDSLYGAGRNNAPYMFDFDHGADTDGSKLIVGHNANGELDLPRNELGRAIIGDPRNDENIIVSQLQLLFLRFHNKVVDRLRSQFDDPSELFEEAQRVVRWHYQWIVVHDFLPRIVGQDVVEDILHEDPYAAAGGPVGRPEIHLRFYRWKVSPFMPVEFSVAAYRFGHSMIRPDYRINRTVPNDIPIFKKGAGEFEDLRGFRPLPKDWTIEWDFFFEVGDGSTLQQARLIDAKLAEPLKDLPGVPPPPALALRNLERGVALGLPSGQRVARAMAVPELPEGDLGLPEGTKSFQGHAPLWFYVLKEAEKRSDGRRLGPVGGRIVAEVLLGLLKGDPFSYINVEPRWTPSLSRANSRFTMPDLINFVDDRDG